MYWPPGQAHKISQAPCQVMHAIWQSMFQSNSGSSWSALLGSSVGDLDICLNARANHFSPYTDLASVHVADRILHIAHLPPLWHVARAATGLY